MNEENKILQFTEMCRPKILKDVLMDPKTKLELERQISGQKDLMNMVFHGRPGSGKSTTARIIASQKRFKGKHKIINASQSISKVSDFKIMQNFIDQGNALSDILDDGSTAYRLIVLEEADYLKPTVSAALRFFLDANHEKARFIFTMNSLARMTPALESRLMILEFDPEPVLWSGDTSVPNAATVSYLDRICKILKKAGLVLLPGELEELFEKNCPDLRKFENEVQWKALPVSVSGA